MQNFGTNGSKRKLIAKLSNLAILANTSKLLKNLRGILRKFMMINLLFALILIASTVQCSEPQNNILLVRALKYEGSLFSNFLNSTKKAYNRQELLAADKQGLRSLGKQAMVMAVVSASGLGVFYKRQLLSTWWQLFASKMSERYASLRDMLQVIAQGSSEPDSKKEDKSTKETKDLSKDTIKDGSISKNGTDTKSVKPDEKPKQGSVTQNGSSATAKDGQIKGQSRPKPPAMASRADNGAGVGKSVLSKPISGLEEEKAPEIKQSVVQSTTVQNSQTQSLGQSTESSNTASSKDQSKKEQETKVESLGNSGIPQEGAVLSDEAKAQNKKKFAKIINLSKEKSEQQKNKGTELEQIASEVVQLSPEEIEQELLRSDKKESELQKKAANTLESKEQAPQDTVKELSIEKKETVTLEVSQQASKIEEQKKDSIRSLPTPPQKKEQKQTKQPSEQESKSIKPKNSTQNGQKDAESRKRNGKVEKKQDKKKKGNSPKKVETFVELSDDEVNMMSKRAQKKYHADRSRYLYNQRMLESKAVDQKFKEEAKLNGWDVGQQEALKKYRAKNNPQESRAGESAVVSVPENKESKENESPVNDQKNEVAVTVVQQNGEIPSAVQEEAAEDNDSIPELTLEQKEQKKKEQEEQWKKDAERKRLERTKSPPPRVSEGSITEQRKNLGLDTMSLKRKDVDIDTKVKQHSIERKTSPEKLSERHKKLLEIAKRGTNESEFKGLVKGEQELALSLLKYAKEQERNKESEEEKKRLEFLAQKAKEENDKKNKDTSDDKDWDEQGNNVLEGNTTVLGEINSKGAQAQLEEQARKATEEQERKDKLIAGKERQEEELRKAKEASERRKLIEKAKEENDGISPEEWEKNLAELLNQSQSKKSRKQLDPDLQQQLDARRQGVRDTFKAPKKDKQ